MKRFYAILPLFFFPVIVFCQNKPHVLSGKLLEKGSMKPVEFLKVINKTRQILSYSDSAGLFSIPCNISDTIIFSGIGFETLSIKISDSLLAAKYKVIIMEPEMLMFEKADINAFGTKEEFIKKFLALKINEQKINPGLPESEHTVPKLSDDKYVKNPLFAITSPVSFLYYNLNRKEISKRRIINLMAESEIIDKKYNRRKVGGWTGLKGEDLTGFILFCNFKNDWLISASQYEIILKVNEKFLEYKKPYPDKP